MSDDGRSMGTGWDFLRLLWERTSRSVRIAGVIALALLAMHLLNAPPPITPPSRSATTTPGSQPVVSCDSANISFWASVDAKETLEAEGRLTADLERFHNNQIITYGDIIESQCGGRYER